MNYNDIVALFQIGKPVDVEFTKKMEQYDTAIDAGMRGTIKSISPIDGSNCFFIEFDLSKFDMYNDKFMQTNWYDKNGIACLTAKESGFYPKNNIERVWFDTISDDVYFNQINVSKLYNQYIETKPAISYVEWLENKLTNI